MQALLEVVDSGAKNMEIAIVRFGKANEVRTRVDVGSASHTIVAQIRVLFIGTKWLC